jgi:hypothetical protein
MNIRIWKEAKVCCLQSAKNEKENQYDAASEFKSGK